MQRSKLHRLPQIHSGTQLVGYSTVFAQRALVTRGLQIDLVESLCSTATRLGHADTYRTIPALQCYSADSRQKPAFMARLHTAHTSSVKLVRGQPDWFKVTLLIVCRVAEWLLEAKLNEAGPGVKAIR
jgi:hypothetical protein